MNHNYARVKTDLEDFDIFRAIVINSDPARFFGFRTIIQSDRRILVVGCSGSYYLLHRIAVHT